MENQQLSLKTIPVLEGYMADKAGNIHSNKTNRTLANRTNRDGYVVVTLSIKGKPKVLPVHRLVALTFLANPENLPCVHHLDDCKSNNSVENLVWCTYAYNNQQDRLLKGESRSERKWNTGLRDKFQKEVLNYKAQGLSNRAIALKVGLSNNTVGKIVKESSTTIRL